MRIATVLLIALAATPPVLANAGTDVCGEGATALVYLTRSLSCTGSLTQGRSSGAHLYRAQVEAGDLLWLNVTPDAALQRTYACIRSQDFQRGGCDVGLPTHRVAFQSLIAQEARMSFSYDFRAVTTTAPYTLEFVWSPPVFAVQEAAGTLTMGAPLHPDLAALPPSTNEVFVHLDAPIRPRQELVVSWQGDPVAERSVDFEVGNRTGGVWQGQPMDCVATAPHERTCRADDWTLWAETSREEWLRVVLDAGLEARWTMRYTYWQDAAHPLS